MIKSDSLEVQEVYFGMFDKGIHVCSRFNPEPVYPVATKSKRCVQGEI